MPETEHFEGFDLSPKGIQNFHQKLPKQFQKALQITGLSPDSKFIHIAGASNLAPDKRASMLLENRFKLSRQSMGPLRGIMTLMWVQNHAPGQLSSFLKEATFKHAYLCIMKAGLGEKILNDMKIQNTETMKKISQKLTTNTPYLYQEEKISPPEKDVKTVKKDIEKTSPTTSNKEAAPHVGF